MLGFGRRERIADSEDGDRNGALPTRAQKLQGMKTESQ